jgi:inositol 1,4,5-triphosphate receptor type 3
VSETLVLLDVICGSTTGGLGLLGLYINENNVALINQILETLTEYCQVRGHPIMTSCKFEKESLAIKRADELLHNPNLCLFCGYKSS